MNPSKCIFYRLMKMLTPEVQTVKAGIKTFHARPIVPNLVLPYAPPFSFLSSSARRYGGAMGG